MKKIFTLIVVLFPILSVYETFITRLSVADGILLVLFPVFLVDVLLKRKIIYSIQKKPIIIFLCYIGITFLIQNLLNTNVGLLSTIRYMLYLAFVMFSFDYFDFKYGIKILEKITILVSIYVIIQFFSYIMFSITLPWYIPGLRVIDQNFITIKESQYYLIFYRPTGIFLEPTHFAQFTIVYLIYLLFYDVKSKTKIIRGGIISTAVVMTGSSLGLILLVFIWTMWFVKKQIYNFSPYKIVLVVIILFLISHFVFNIEYFEKIISRIISDGTFSGVAVGYRFNSLSFFKQNDIPLINWIIGYGRSTEKTYFTGIFYFLINNGILGLVIYLWICLDVIKRNKMFARWLVITVLILSIGSEFIANYGILFYFPFVYGSTYISDNYKKNSCFVKEEIT